MVFDPGSILMTEGLKKLTTLIIDTVWKQSGQAIDKQLQPQVEDAVRKYVQTYEKRHCSLKYDCLRMDNSLSLDEIYTDVQVLNTRESRRFETPEALRELFLETGRGFVFEKTTRQEGIAAANLEPRLMVLGSPGIGKSTFLRKVGLEALKWETARFRHELIPVFIELKQFGAEHTDIEKLIAEEFETCGFPKAEIVTQDLLKAGKLLILLDGLDEVPTDYVDRAIEQIKDLVDRYDKNRFIASCRIAAFKGGFPRFKDVTLANFSDLQIETFVRRWFHREPTIADRCWELLQSKDYAAAKELGQTPLLLTLLCAVYSESQSLPKRRAGLYGAALEVWLVKWASEKRIQHDPIYQELSLELEYLLLSEIAYHSFAADQLFLSKRELTDQIRSFLMTNLNAPKSLDAEKVLNAIEKQQGILVERAINVYSFSHLTFQEYLTAQYIVDEQQIETLVKNYLTDSRWYEVFFLVSSMMRNADALLNLMESETQRLIDTEKLKALIKWVDGVRHGSAGDFKPAAKRSGLLFYVLNRTLALELNRVLTLNLDLDHADCGSVVFVALNLVLALDRDVANTFFVTLNRTLARDPDYNSVFDFDHVAMFAYVDFQDLAKQLEAMRNSVPSNAAPLEVRRAFAAQLQQTWCEALHLNPEWLELSQEELELLRSYLYANQLMIGCKEAALRVSPQVWNAIESRMLTVQDD